MIELVTLVAFVLVVGLVLWVAHVARKLHRDPIRQGLATAAGMEAPPNDRAATRGTLVQSFASQLPEFTAGSDELDKDLRRAGYYRPTARQEYLAIRNALVILVVVLVGALAAIVGPQREATAIRVLGVGLLVAAVFWSIPRVLLAVRAKRRVGRVCRALPDGLDMISMCLTGGASLQDALSHVGPQLFAAHSDLAVELMIVRQQADMSSLEFAIEKFAQRIDAPDTATLAALVTQNQRLGTSVVGSVREYADNMRSTRRQLADEKAGKAQVKLLFPVVFCFLPSLIILLWGSAILELWSFFQELGGP
ncbi:MAG TPA: type II secretion system F family protein [Thermoguttaceae bacterium]|nr:type II secretion system F family protein [Thermoguttaceae bacterium]